MENSNKNIKKSKNTKAKTESKPSGKVKTIPPVRQTLTSYKRMLKANPFLRYQEAGIDVDQLLGFKSEGTSLKEGVALAVADLKASSCLQRKESVKEFKKPEVKPLKRTESLKLPKTKGLDFRVNKMAIISGNLPLTNNHFKKPISVSLHNNSNLTAVKYMSENTSKNICSYKSEIRPVESQTNSLFPKHSTSLKCKSEISTNKVISETDNINYKTMPKSEISSLRRSVSLNDLQNKKSDTNIASTQHRNAQLRERNIYTSANSPNVSPITEVTCESNNFIFKSPSAYERRSICSFTPHSLKKTPHFEASTPAFVETEYLQERLIKWLKARGKSKSDFKNLRCFDKRVPHKKPTFSVETDEENKENKITAERSEIVTTPESSKIDMSIQNDTPEEELPIVAKMAMVELQKLIQEDYPREQCLGWLELIKAKYKKADGEPEYWKCRAVIEQSVGNVGNAVEFYKTAIIQGAEVSAVDKSLDQLLTKFSLLNISPNKSKTKKFDEDKARIVNEARTVFKSTIIQCAVQERILKK